MTDGNEQRPPGSWWADALNPVENLRALADVQQFGRRVAEDVADRFLAAGSTRDSSHDGDDPEVPELDALLRRMRADSVRAADLWADLIDGAAAVIGAMAARLPRIGSGEDRDAPDLVLGPVSPGAVASGVFWVHNSSATAVDGVRPHCAPLRSHLGEELGADVVTFDPPALTPLPPRSSCGIEVSVAVPATAAPSTYATVVLVENVPSTFLPLRVAVASDPAAE